VWCNALITYRIFTSFSGQLFFIFEILTQAFVHLALRQLESGQLLLSLTSRPEKQDTQCTCNLTLAHSHACCSGKATIICMCIVEVNDTLNNITILIVAQKRFFWWICVAGNSETYLGLLEKCPIFLPNFNQIWSSSTDIYKASKIKFHGNPSNGSRADTRTDVMKVTDVFRNYANPPNRTFYEILNFPNKKLWKQNRFSWWNWRWKISYCVNFDRGDCFKIQHISLQGYGAVRFIWVLLGPTVLSNKSQK
jgi:hypothetical protein